jgi:pilus assembly protein CpaE
MIPLSVAIFGADEDQCAILKMQVDGTGVAKTVALHSNLPESGRDPTLRSIEEVGAKVVIVDISGHDPGAAIRSMELIHAMVPEVEVFAVGDASKPQVILSAMRAAAREFLERPTSIDSLLEVFARLNSTHRKALQDEGIGKVVTFLNAKGGSGSTTVAVNTAVSLQKQGGNVAIVDLAPIGHAALHLNQKPAFTILDALQKVNQLDRSLLDAYMMRCVAGLHLLSGTEEPILEAHSTTDYARLLDVLVAHYTWVIVDASSRLDAVTRSVCDLSERVFLVTQTDITSLWSASKVQRFISQSAGGSRIALVLNRFRKISGFGDPDIEHTVHVPVIWKIPNQYASVSAGIDRGSPVSEQRTSEIAKSFAGLANLLRGVGHSESTQSTISLLGIKSNG